MSVEDKKMSRLLMREISKRQDIDTSEARVTVTRQVGYVGGVIRPAMPGMTIEPKEEIKGIIDSSRRVPGLRDCVVDARFDLGSKK